MSYYIDVILPIPLVKLFTYSINEEEAKFLMQGMRIAVPFGKSKIVTGLVYSVHQEAPKTYEAKDIHQILDEFPVVTTQQIKHWEWISSYYMCSVGEVMKAALPGAFLFASETLVSKGSKGIDELELSDQEYLICEALELHSELKVQEIMDLIQRKNVFGVLKSLLGKEAIKLR
ncbi:MAG: primosomal protein N', partial [Flavobacteriaceae bacterium]|nr:primosomal protein N' [Flavobacteriaceae bacterium]